jgi:hypothetical protein
MLTINLSLFFLLKVTSEWYQIQIPHLVIVILMYYFSLVSFLLLKLTSKRFDTKSNIAPEPNFLGRLLQHLIALITPSIIYVIAIKYDENIFLFITFCLVNSSLSMAQAIKLIKVK